MGHGGKNDLKKGTAIQNCIQNLQRLANPFRYQLSLWKKMISWLSQLKLCSVTLYLNITRHLLVVDHFTRLCKDMFPDSKIAQKFSCGKTKTTQTVKRATAPTLNKTVVAHCWTNSFSLSIDESNDKNAEINLVILLKIYDPASQMAVTRLPVCNIGNTENILNKVDDMWLHLPLNIGIYTEKNRSLVDW